MSEIKEPETVTVVDTTTHTAAGLVNRDDGSHVITFTTEWGYEFTVKLYPDGTWQVI